MPIHNCPECGFEISDGESLCPNCGFIVAPEAQVDNQADAPQNPDLPPENDTMSDSEVLPIVENPTEGVDTADGTKGLPIDLDDENLRRGCLIVVGVISAILLVIMMIVTFNLGTGR